jgi:hypothetical protein
MLESCRAPISSTRALSALRRSALANRWTRTRDSRYGFPRACAGARICGAPSGGSPSICARVIHAPGRTMSSRWFRVTPGERARRERCPVVRPQSTAATSALRAALPPAGEGGAVASARGCWVARCAASRPAQCGPPDTPKPRHCA